MCFFSEDHRLTVLQSYRVLDSGPEDVFDTLVGVAATLTEAPMAVISLMDESRQWFKARVGIELTEAPRDISFCGHTLRDSSGIMDVEDALIDSRFANNPLVVGPPYVRFYSGVALVNPDKHRLGTLCVMDRKPRRLSSVQRDILTHLAEVITTTLELRRIHLRTRGRKRPKA